MIHRYINPLFYDSPPPQPINVVCNESVAFSLLNIRMISPTHMILIVYLLDHYLDPGLESLKIQCSKGGEGNS
jgi:hypothetical protein